MGERQVPCCCPTLGHARFQANGLAFLLGAGLILLAFGCGRTATLPFGEQSTTGNPEATGSNTNSVTTTAAGTTAQSSTAATGTAATGSTAAVEPPDPEPPLGSELPVACPAVPLESNGCVSTSFGGSLVPVDLVIMLDSSASMANSTVNGISRWQMVTESIKSFVAVADASSLSLSLDFFSWSDEADCDVANYATPTVPLAPLAEVRELVSDALDQVTPSGQTPTFSALQGAIQYAKTQANAHPSHRTAIIFITDGYPTRCESTAINEIADLAATSWKEPPTVPVYVIGIDGSYGADRIAHAGGTLQAQTIDNGGDLEALVTALSSIAELSQRCHFAVTWPPGVPPDINLVQVFFTSTSHDVLEFPRLTSPELCTTSPNGGFYVGSVDADANATEIVLCPCSCALAQTGPVDYGLGCPPLRYEP